MLNFENEAGGNFLIYTRFGIWPTATLMQ